jgi:hypothetical protein
MIRHVSLALVLLLGAVGVGAAQHPTLVGGPDNSEANFATKAAFVAAAATTRADRARIEAVAPTDARGAATCPLSYRRAPTPAGLYGEVSVAGAHWSPIYSTAPVKACEFGVVGDAWFPRGGTGFVASSGGGRRLTTSAAPRGIVVGMMMTIANPATNAALAPPPATTVLALEPDGLVLSADAPACANCSYIAWFDINASNVVGADNTAALQAAIDFALQNSFNEVYLSPGMHKVTDTIHLGYGDAFRTVRLVGSARPGFAPGLGGTFVVSTATDRPAISIQGGRMSGVTGIALYGPNYNYAAHGQWFSDLLSANDADWIAPHLARRDNAPGGLQRHSPLVGIAIDAYAGAAPSDAFPPVAYPAWTRIAGQYRQRYSSEATIEASVYGFAVGIAAGLNADYNGDFIRIRNGQFAANAYAIAICNHQSRNVEIRNLAVGGVHTTLSNTRFGTQNGQWNGPIDNLSVGGAYQVADFNALSYSGPLIFRNLYCENCVRIGRFVNTASFGASVMFDGGIIKVGDSAHGHIPPALIVAGGAQTIEFRGTSFALNRRISNLVYSSATVNLRLDGVTMQSAARNAGGSEALQLALNYTGGLFYGSPKYNTLGLDRTSTVRSYGSYYATPGEIIGSQDFDASMGFSASGALRPRLRINQAARGMQDSQGRDWRFQTPPPVSIELAAPAYAPSPPAFSCDVLRFSLSAAAYADARLRATPGWLLYHASTGTVFVVTEVAAPDASGAHPITALQQNNLRLDDKGGCVANLLSDTRLGGYTVLVPVMPFASRQMHYGSFAAGSTEVRDVSRGDGAAGDLSAWIVPGDTLTGPLHNDSYEGGWPISRAGNAIATVTNGAPGSVTLARPAAVTGRFPLFAVPVR